MKSEIRLVQSPIITHKLLEVGKTVSKRINDLDLDKQVATIETVKTLKELRTELNKELTDFETQRKIIKEGVNNPYLEFESLYKTEISEKYKSAIDTLKDKITFIENKIKSEKKESIDTYFKELCVAEKIDFISFDKLGIEINLSTSEKKYKDKVYDYITKVNDDLKLIKVTDFEAEILTEYKSSLNVSSAITSVKTRKENEAKEAARLKAEITQKRKNELVLIGMNYVEITNAYEFNADIYLTVEDIENLSNQDYIKKIADLEIKIKDLKVKCLDTTEESKHFLTKTEFKAIDKLFQPTPITENPVIVKKTHIAAPVSAPSIQSPKETEPLKTASFTVTATMTQLRALGAYMKQNNITYKNI